MNLTRIYTRTGDDGTTGLGDFSRTSKTDPRLIAFAEVDEANCAIGVALATSGDRLGPDMLTLLQQVQNDLFDVGADLCTPLREQPGGQRSKSAPLRITPDYIARLEQACDQWNAELPPLRSFVLPGGTMGSALLHVARTVTRRAERSVWAAIAQHGDEPDGGVNPETARYLNRLSDLLFILCRTANGPRGDVLWVPGGKNNEKV